MSIHNQSRCAFTVIEVLAVITVASLTAATVVPAVAQINRARALAGVYEAARLLELARASGVSSGHPNGVRFDARDGTATLIAYDGSTETEPSFQSITEPTVALYAAYGTEVTDVRFSEQPGTPANPDRAALWFDHRGVPHLRSETDGSWIDLAAPPRIEFASGATITVHTISGLIEVRP